MSNPYIVRIVDTVPTPENHLSVFLVTFASLIVLIEKFKI